MSQYSDTNTDDVRSAQEVAEEVAQVGIDDMPLLRDRYRVVKALAQGGFGATYLAKDMSLPGEPECVIKQLRPTSNVPHVLQMARDLFKREAKTLGKIGNHPQVPRLLDYFEIDQEFYLVQEYIRGNTLQQEVKQGGPFTEAGVKQFLSEVLPVLQYLHNNQVIHRDIKPANLIRRTEDAKLVMIDFGAVKDQVNPNVGAASEQTALTSYAIGTPGYAPPEQMAMRPVYASDIYALGVTCIYLLSGKAPKDMDYDPMTGELLWQKYIHVSDHFIGVLKKMLEVSVKHRYQSANDLLRALDLEPYLDSLAKGMATQPSSSSRTPGKGVGGTSDAPSSPMSRAAAGIRTRHARLSGSGSAGTLESGLVKPRTTVKPVASRTPTSENTAPLAPKVPINPQQKKLDGANLKLAYSKGERDFSQCDLSNAVVNGANLQGANFNQSKLNKASFQGANLHKVDFGRAALVAANLRDANLSKTYCSYANFQGADLRGANLTNAYLSNANLRGANLCGANLTGAQVSNDQLAQARTNLLTILPSGKKGLWGN
jgi:serine/threonine-protein kinase